MKFLSKICYIKIYIVMRQACLIGLLVLLRVMWFNTERVQGVLFFFLLTWPLPDVKIGYLRR
jgi:hypothetical protein